MLSTIASYFTGRAAKAGIAAVMGAIGAPGAVASTEYMTSIGGDLTMSFLGYVVVGALGGAINWASVYFKRNEPTDWQRQNGLY